MIFLGSCITKRSFEFDENATPRRHFRGAKPRRLSHRAYKSIQRSGLLGHSREEDEVCLCEKVTSAYISPNCGAAYSQSI
jgi:hypothetical protein